mmetsp:Transcript_140327/g.315068  ORF Transcript_140327/g.315068 Transcript_140327/m.315068 type:complete len:118 (-) Transcript_140327:65-418(-)
MKQEEYGKGRRRVVHTPQWMAPEVMKQEEYGRAADVWALGMLLFEMLDLGPPYGDQLSLPELEAKVTAGELPALRDPTAAGRAPVAFKVMKACLATATERPTAQQVAEMLQQGLSGP